MAGRKKEPDGRRVTISAKFSETEAAQIDSQRGNETRSAWLRRKLLATTDGPKRSRDCTHPGVIKGVCRACGEWVGAK